MVWEWRCHSIVMLTELKEREQVQYGALAKVQAGKWSFTFKQSYYIFLFLIPDSLCVYLIALYCFCGENIKTRIRYKSVK